MVHYRSARTVWFASVWHIATSTKQRNTWPSYTGKNIEVAKRNTNFVREHCVSALSRPRVRDEGRVTKYETPLIPGRTHEPEQRQPFNRNLMHLNCTEIELLRVERSLFERRRANRPVLPRNSQDFVYDRISQNRFFSSIVWYTVGALARRVSFIWQK